MSVCAMSGGKANTMSVCNGGVKPHLAKRGANFSARLLERGVYFSARPLDVRAVLLLVFAVLCDSCGTGSNPMAPIRWLRHRLEPNGPDGRAQAWATRRLLCVDKAWSLALRGGGVRTLRSAKGPAAEASAKETGHDESSSTVATGCISPFSAALRRAKSMGSASGPNRGHRGLVLSVDEAAASCNTTLRMLQQHARLSVLGADAYVPVLCWRV
jgi:hypothetical protein